MKDLVTPKQVARAMGVSESSVKRWCDKGLLRTQYTAGGHRRIATGNVIEFLKVRSHQLVEPELLGLPATIGQSDRVIHRAAKQLEEAVLSGNESVCRQILFDLYLANHKISAICDQVIAPVFEQIGRLWECGSAEVYQERRGCELTLRSIQELRNALPTPPAEAPLALGGAPEGDQYNLATTLVELVLRDNGWNAASLGDNLPLATMAAAIRQHRPRLFWLSVSHLQDSDTFISEYAQLTAEFGTELAFVVGGRGLLPEVRQQMRYSAYCDNMNHLEAFAQTFHLSELKQQ
jgi:methanogenic corrinoid protein MtbC1